MASLLTELHSKLELLPLTRTLMLMPMLMPMQIVLVPRMVLDEVIFQ
jgi:hypothetical protein